MISEEKKAYNRKYYLQGAMAVDGLAKLTDRPDRKVINFVVSKRAPYLSCAYQLSSGAIDQGRKEYKYGAKVYKQCSDSGIWPGYNQRFELLDLPGWAKFGDDNE